MVGLAGRACGIFGHFGGLDTMKRKKDLKRKTGVSDKIEANKEKIYRMSDPIQLAEVFYAAKNAHQRRAAFLGIFFEIKNAEGQNLDSTDHIADKYGLSQSSVTKARRKMSRLGLIRKREGCWIFSTVFCNALDRLKEKISQYQYPSISKEQRELERMYIEVAKGVKG
jgi:DNA-binding transcriptional regulator YhcF (GntR family)